MDLSPAIDPSNATNNGDSPGSKTDAAMAERAEQLMSEAPAISVAVHNFFACLLAEGFADATTMHLYTKALLQAVSSHDMLPTPAWGAANPQGPEQSGSSRMAQLGECKVLFTVWRVAKQSGARPSKLLGRTWLRFVYPDIEAAVLERLREQEGDLLEEFLRRFETELRLEDGHGYAAPEPEAAAAGEENGETVNPPPRSSIFWAADFDAAMKERQQAREAEAVERADRQKKLEAEMARVATAGLSAGAGDDAEELDVGAAEPLEQEIDGEWVVDD